MISEIIYTETELQQPSRVVCKNETHAQFKARRALQKYALNAYTKKTLKDVTGSYLDHLKLFAVVAGLTCKASTQEVLNDGIMKAAENERISLLAARGEDNTFVFKAEPRAKLATAITGFCVTSRDGTTDHMLSEPIASEI